MLISLLVSIPLCVIPGFFIGLAGDLSVMEGMLLSYVPTFIIVAVIVFIIKENDIVGFTPLAPASMDDSPLTASMRRSGKCPEALPEELIGTKAAVFRRALAPKCDTQELLECPKTGTKDYYRIERNGVTGMRHYLHEGLVQELFPFNGVDDIDFEDAWLRIHGD